MPTRLSMINKTLIMPRKNNYANKVHIKYDNQNTKYANQKFMLFCHEAIFVTKLRTFWRTFCRPKSMVAYQKRHISGMNILKTQLIT